MATHKKKKGKTKIVSYSTTEKQEVALQEKSRK